MRILFVIALIAAPTFAMAQDCPAGVDVTGELDQLITQAQEAGTVQQGRAASDGMWKVWLRAPDEKAQAMLDRGMAARGSFDFEGAKRAFTELIVYCPDYAEGWNQRAFIDFMREEYDSALSDLDRTLVLQPRHVAAQSGRGLTLMNMGRTAEARKQMLEAVANNPWLSEAALLSKGAPLGLVGDDI
ncbi:MAG: hypothetical protein WBG95_12755 [Sulfitobacter sp.]